MRRKAPHVNATPCYPSAVSLDPKQTAVKFPAKRIFRASQFFYFCLCRGVLVGFLSERPPYTTDPATLAGDGGTLDYCAKPTLDGTGKNAVDIPKGNTPGCSYSHFPLPILAECTSPGGVPTTFAGCGAPFRVAAANISSALNNAATAQ